MHLLWCKEINMFENPSEKPKFIKFYKEFTALVIKYELTFLDLISFATAISSRYAFDHMTLESWLDKCKIAWNTYLEINDKKELN